MRHIRHTLRSNLSNNMHLLLFSTKQAVPLLRSPQLARALKKSPILLEKTAEMTEKYLIPPQMLNRHQPRPYQNFLSPHASLKHAPQRTDWSTLSAKNGQSVNVRYLSCRNLLNAVVACNPHLHKRISNWTSSCGSHSLTSFRAGSLQITLEKNKRTRKSTWNHHIIPPRNQTLEDSCVEKTIRKTFFMRAKHLEVPPGFTLIATNETTLWVKKSPNDPSIAVKYGLSR